MRLGVRFHPEWNPDGLLSYAQSVEELGYDELWFSEDCFWPGGMALAGAALSVTTRIGVGVGLFAAPVRNPATAAMEISALSALAPGRFTAAFGHGLAIWMEQIGVRPAEPVAFLAETVDAVHRLLAGELINVSTERLHLADVQLGTIPSVPPPILVGTTGPKGFAVACRCADGVLLPELACPASVRWTREVMASFGSPGQLVAFAYMNLNDDGARAVAAVEPLIIGLARSGAFPHLLRLAEVDPFSDRPLEAETVHLMSVAGTRDDCLEALQRWQQCGVDTLVLLPPTEDGPAQVTRFAAEVLPALQPG
jgi:5,10-methylenetetrahydromethanopterin reductase